MPTTPGPRARTRVLHLDHTVEPGGAELALRRLLLCDEAGWEAELVVPSTPDLGAFAAVAEAGIPVAQVGAAQRPGASTSGARSAASFATAILGQAAAVRRHLRRSNPDVVHANSTRSALYAALAVTGTRRPLVVHLRDRIDPESLGTIGFQAFRRVVIPRANAFIANSDATANTIRPFVRRGQEISVVPSPIGIDLREVGGGEPRPEGRPLRIGMVARLDSWKGQREFLEAFERAGISDVARPVLIGDAAFGKEPYRRELEAFAKDRSVPVDFLGFVDDVRGAIDSLDICVQYSLRPEPLGQNVLQYLAAGKPTLVSAEGGPLEWVTDGVNGLLVQPRDTAELASALDRIVHDAGLRAKLAAGASAVELLTDADSARAHAEVFLRAG